MPEGLTPNGTPEGNDQGDASLQTRVPDYVYAYIQTLRQESADRRKTIDSFNELGDIDTLKRAKALYEATGSDEGVRQIFDEAAERLGIDITSLNTKEA